MVKSEREHDDDQRGPRYRGRGQEGVRTRARMVDAALTTLIEEGYGGSSARVIAARGGFNPALVFYHFGSVDQLLLAALDKSSHSRLERYRGLLLQPLAPDELVRKAAALFREDVEGGAVIAATELIGASLARPELRSEVVARMRPWLELAREVIDRQLAESHLGAFAPAAEPVAFAIVSLYLGLNMLNRLEPDLSEVDALFEFVAQLTQLALPGTPSTG